MADTIFPLATPTQAGGQIPVAHPGGGTTTGIWNGSGGGITIITPTGPKTYY